MKKYLVLVQAHLGSKAWTRREVAARNPEAALYQVISPEYDDAPDEFIEAKVYEIAGNKAEFRLTQKWSRSR